MACAKSELCIFDRPPPQVVVENYTFEEIYPLNAIGKEIQFNIIGSANNYLDLNDSLFYVKLKVTQSDGTALPDAAAVIPSNYFFYTLFKNATLLFNNVKIEGGDDTYSSKAVLESILNYNTDTRNTNLMSIGFSDDENVRKGWIAKSKEFSMTGPLRLNLFNQPKYLLPCVNVTIKLRRNINGCSSKTSY
jgi:hypothetical protein